MTQSFVAQVRSEQRDVWVGHFPQGVSEEIALEEQARIEVALASQVWLMRRRDFADVLKAVGATERLNEDDGRATGGAR